MKTQNDAHSDLLKALEGSAAPEEDWNVVAQEQFADLVRYETLNQTYGAILERSKEKLEVYLRNEAIELSIDIPTTKVRSPLNLVPDPIPDPPPLPPEPESPPLANAFAVGDWVMWVQKDGTQRTEKVSVVAGNYIKAGYASLDIREHQIHKLAIA